MQQSLGLKESRPKVAGPLLALSLALGTPALAAGTPAGTIIRNQATLEYLLLSGTPETITTPPVETVVSPVCSVSVLPNGTVSAPGQSLSLDPGQSGLLRYTLFNAGNTTNTYALEADNEAGSQFRHLPGPQRQWRRGQRRRAAEQRGGQCRPDGQSAGAGGDGQRGARDSFP